MTRRTAIRLGLTLLITGGCLAYILWQLDVRRTIEIVLHSHLGWFFGAVAIMIGGVPPMAFRWQKLMAARAPLRAGLPGEPVYGMLPEAGLPFGWKQEVAA